MRFLSDILAKAGLIVDGAVTFNNVPNATVDTDKFLVIDSGAVKYRTGAQMLSDIGAAAAAAGLPVGGTAGQILAKVDETNYNTTWIDNYTSSVKHLVKLGEPMTAGTPVYVSGGTGNAGTNMIVSKASNASEAASSKTMGLIATTGVLNDERFVVTEGLLAGLNTSAATISDPVWLGPNGTLLFGLANKPVAPNHLVYLGVVTRVSSTNGEIFVKVQNGYELDELHDVLVTNVLDKHVLYRDAATNLWKNASIATILGFTPVNGNIYTTDGSLTGNRILTGANFSLQMTFNGISGNGLHITSTSTAAAGNAQILLNVSLTGANANANQVTTAIYGNNAHTGTGSTNYGVMGIAANGTTNIGVYGQSSNGSGLYGISTSGNGVEAVSTSGTAVSARSNTGIPLYAYRFSPNAINVETILVVAKFASVTTGDGVGAAIEYQLECSGNAGYLSNRLISKWTTAADATRTSQFIITGVSIGTEADLFTINGIGSARLNKYGVSSFTGTAASLLAVDASGNIIEVNPSSVTVTGNNVNAVLETDYDYDILGSRNSVNKTFTLSANFIAGTTRVFINGIRLTPGASYDYVEQSSNQITFTNAPDAGDLIVVDYIKA